MYCYLFAVAVTRPVPVWSCAVDPAASCAGRQQWQTQPGHLHPVRRCNQPRCSSSSQQWPQWSSQCSWQQMAGGGPCRWKRRWECSSSSQQAAGSETSVMVPMTYFYVLRVLHVAYALCLMSACRGQSVCFCCAGASIALYDVCCVLLVFPDCTLGTPT